MISRFLLLSAFGILFATLGSGDFAFAAVHKTSLQSIDFPSPIYRTVTVRTIIEAGSDVPPHTHPGLETAYIVSGEARLQVAGHGARSLGAGQSFAIPAKTVHSVANIGRGPLTIVSTYVVNKSEPLSSPAPMPR